jgi:hypothetical protein
MRPAEGDLISDGALAQVILFSVNIDLRRKKGYVMTLAEFESAKIAAFKEKHRKKELTELPREELIVKLSDISNQVAHLSGALGTLGNLANCSFTDRESGGLCALLLALSEQAERISRELEMPLQEFWAAKEAVEQTEAEFSKKWRQQ